MNNGQGPDYNDLHHKLLHAVSFSKKGRLARLLRHPLRMSRVKLLRATGKNKEIRAKTFWGGQMNVIFPEMLSIHVLRDGYFESDVCLYMMSQLREGMTFLDVGAHFGFFSLLGGYLVGPNGKVISLEPTPSTYSQLEKNITAYNDNTNVTIRNHAAHSENRELVFYDHGVKNSAYNSPVGMSGMSRTCGARLVTHKISVQARKIDDVVAEEELRKVDLIKIDAESSEMEVLKGMSKTLEKHSPALILEVGDFQIEGVPTTNEIIRYLLNLGYAVFGVRNGEISPHVVQDNYEYGNLLFIKNSA